MQLRTVSGEIDKLLATRTSYLYPFAAVLPSKVPVILIQSPGKTLHTDVKNSYFD